MYKITIKRLIENPKFEEERKEINYGRSRDIPYEGYGNRLFEEKVLEVELTEDEFKAVKKAVIDVM